jgi:hypothetical protein
MEANASNALPAAPVAPASLEALAARVERLESQQLLLPGLAAPSRLLPEVPGSPLLAFVVGLLQAHGGPKTTRELMVLGGDSIIELAGMPSSVKGMTVVIQKAAPRGGPLRIGLNRDKVFVWSLR